MPYVNKTVTKTYKDTSYDVEEIIFVPSAATKLCAWDASFGRMGSLSGLFFAEEATIQELKDNEVYLGEVLGKHSGISYQIDPDDFTFYDTAPRTITDLSHVIDTDTFTLSGTNILFTCIADLFDNAELDENQEYIENLETLGIILKDTPQ
jgi:hypothetical protein